MKLQCNTSVYNYIIYYTNTYRSVRLMRHRSCCFNLSASFGCCCWFCVSTSLRLFPELVEIHLPWLMCWLARTICLAYDGSADVTLVSLENIFGVCCGVFIYTSSSGLIRVFFWCFCVFTRCKSSIYYFCFSAHSRWPKQVPLVCTLCGLFSQTFDRVFSFRSPPKCNMTHFCLVRCCSLSLSLAC